MRQKYEQAMKEKMLMKLERDKLKTRVRNRSSNQNEY